MSHLYLLQQAPFPIAPGVRRIELTDGPARPLGPGWWHVPDPARGPRPLRRTAHRAVLRLRRTLGGLWGTGPDLPETASDVLCQCDTRPGHTGIAAYGGVRLDGSDHYVHAMGSMPPAGVRDLARLQLISGVCLFSSQAARLVVGGCCKVSIARLRREPLTERATGLDLLPHLTLYEQDSSLRLACAAASVAARVPPEVEVTQLFAVPRAATMLLLHRHAERGQVPPDVFAAWCEAVADRHDQVQALLRARWQAAWATTGTHRPITVEDVDELQQVEACLRTALDQGLVPSVQELADAARAQDALWRHLITLSPPATALDLAHLSYVATYLRHPGVTLAVENIQERKIYRHAALLRARLQKLTGDPVPVLTGLYPLGRAWIRTLTGDLQHNLFSVDPGQEVIDEGRRRVYLPDLAARLYPAAASDLVAHQ